MQGEIYLFLENVFQEVGTRTFKSLSSRINQALVLAVNDEISQLVKDMRTLRRDF